MPTQIHLLRDLLRLAVSALLICCATAATAAEDSEESLPSFASRDLVAIFDAQRFELENPSGGSGIDYRLFKPTIAEADKTYPMIVLLHGIGADEINHPNIGQLKYIQSLVFRDPTHPEKYP